MGASAVLKLQKAGFNVEQVEALADFMDTQAASKADLEAAEHRLETKIAEVKSEVALLSARMEQQNSALLARMDQQNSALSTRIEQQNSALLARMEQQNSALSTRIEQQNSALSTRIEQQNSALSARMDQQNSAHIERLEWNFSTLSEQIKRSSAEADAKIQSVRNDTLKWIVTTGVVSVITLGGMIVGAAWAIIRYMPTHG